MQIKQGLISGFSEYVIFYKLRHCSSSIAAEDWHSYPRSVCCAITLRKYIQVTSVMDCTQGSISQQLKALYAVTAERNWIVHADQSPTCRKGLTGWCYSTADILHLNWGGSLQVVQPQLHQAHPEVRELLDPFCMSHLHPEIHQKHWAESAAGVTYQQ